MQIILTEEEYNILKDLVNKAENYETLYNELMSQHLALKNDYSKLLVFGVSASSERLKATSHISYSSKLNDKKKGEQSNVN